MYDAKHKLYVTALEEEKIHTRDYERFEPQKKQKKMIMKEK